MGALLVDKRDQLFILNEMLKIEDLRCFPQFSDHSGFDMVLAEAHKFAKSEFYPTSEAADRTGCHYDPKTRAVTFPECFQLPYERFCEGGWLTMCDSPDVGGDGFPLTLGTAVSEVFYAGGFSIYAAAELSHAAAKSIEKYGSDEQKELYMTRLFSGRWMGTMCLTEPDAGSDVGRVQTSATQNDNGTYSISGTKIFITAGEQNLTENIIHMVLARIEGDPPGTRGLSLFIVPKYLADKNGALTKRNDVHCAGIEHKMGLHGLATCTMVFGHGNQCTGYLLGSRCKGIVEMFSMMNEQRLLVGLEGLSFSSAAYLHAVDYTRKRVQGTSVYPSQEGKPRPVAIIEHPDVKRMLLTMKAYVEGCRALGYFTSYCMDYAGVTENGENDEWQALVDLMIPIVKAYLTAKSWDITGMAIQCAGGYGYCADYPFERLARDCKITSIFEGTNGIQAIDLVFRKILGNNQAAFKILLNRIDQTLRKAGDNEDLKKYTVQVEQARADLEEVVDHLTTLSIENATADIHAKASPFLEAMGDVVLGWLHLWQMMAAYPTLMRLTGVNSIDEARKTRSWKKEASFYYGKVAGASFFIENILKRTIGKLEALKSDAAPVVEMFAKSFTG